MSADEQTPEHGTTEKPEANRVAVAPPLSDLERKQRIRMSKPPVGFYACNMFISIGAAVLFFACFVLEDEPLFGPLPIIMKVAGSVMLIVCVPGAFIFLRKSRKVRPPD